MSRLRVVGLASISALGGWVVYQRLFPAPFAYINGRNELKVGNAGFGPLVIRDAELVECSLCSVSLTKEEIVLPSPKWVGSEDTVLAKIDEATLKKIKIGQPWLYIEYSWTNQAALYRKKWIPVDEHLNTEHRVG